MESFSAKTGRVWANRGKSVGPQKGCKPRGTLRMNTCSQVCVHQGPGVELGVLRINLGAECNVYERASNENVTFTYMLLKIITAAIVENKGVIFREECFISDIV